MQEVLLGECLSVLPTLPRAFARLVYIDPPFNTGKVQKRRRIESSQDKDGTRVGFGGRRYADVVKKSASYRDSFEDYVPWLMERIEASIPCTTDDASFIVHVDPRESHYVKVALDGLFGRASF